MFKAQRPLAPNVLRQILNAIAALKPDAIAVDLDTSHASYRPLAEVSWGVPVIWARRATFAQREQRFYAEEFLGGAGSPNNAVIELNADTDGVVRRYRRSLLTDRGDLSLLPVALLNAGGRVDRRKDPERLIDFYGHTWGGHRIHWWPGEIIKASVDKDVANAEPLKGKIVLLGAEYRGNDEHQTPLGWMSGVEILAHIAET